MDKSWNLATGEFWIRNLLILGSAYLGVFEGIQISRDPKGYWFDVYNFMNLSDVLLNILICLSYGYGMMNFTTQTLYLLIAANVFLCWTNCFYWMRFFETTSRYTRMIIASIGKIRDFLFVQLLFIFTFGFSLYFLSKGTDRVEEENPSGGEDEVFIYEPHFVNGVANALFN